MPWAAVDLLYDFYAFNSLMFLSWIQKADSHPLLYMYVSWLWLYNNNLHIFAVCLILHVNVITPLRKLGGTQGSPCNYSSPHNELVSFHSKLLHHRQTSIKGAPLVRVWDACNDRTDWAAKNFTLFNIDHVVFFFVFFKKSLEFIQMICTEVQLQPLGLLACIWLVWRYKKLLYIRLNFLGSVAL